MLEEVSRGHKAKERSSNNYAQMLHTQKVFFGGQESASLRSPMELQPVNKEGSTNNSTTGDSQK